MQLNSNSYDIIKLLYKPYYINPINYNYVFY